MSDFINYTPLLAGVYLILISFMMSTHSFTAMLAFKAAPFFLGAASMLVSLKLLGVV